MSKTKKLVSLVVLTMVIASTSSIAMAKNNSFKRLYGQDRIETSAKIATEHKGSESLNSVIISSAYNFPDSLGATILSSKYNAPILLVGKNSSDSQQTIDFIKSNLNKSGNIYVLGGQGAVSDELLNSLKEAGFNNYVRLSGSDRYETNLAIVKHLNLPEGNPVIVANGTAFPDALSMSPISAINSYPILLTEKNNLSNETLKQIEKIKPAEVYIAGGLGAVSSEIEAQVKTVSPNSKIERFSGTDRYDTSKKIVERFANNFGEKAIIASGENFPDALSGSSLANKYKAPILLAKDSVSNYSSFIKGNKIKDATILGGNAVVSSKIEDELASLIDGTSESNSGASTDNPSNKFENVDCKESATIEYTISSVEKSGDKATVTVSTSVTDSNQLNKLSLMITKFILEDNSDISQIIINYNNGSYTFDSSTVK